MAILAWFGHKHYQVSNREIITYEISPVDVATPPRIHSCPGHRRLGAFLIRVGRALSSGEVFELGHEACPLWPMWYPSVPQDGQPAVAA